MRGSSAKAWNDNAEFATPNLIAKANEQQYKIDVGNINQITSFNPFEVPAVSQKQKNPKFQTKMKNQNMGNPFNIGITEDKENQQMGN